MGALTGDRDARCWVDFDTRPAISAGSEDKKK